MYLRYSVGVVLISMIIFTIIGAKPKVIYLISTPRSLSTVFLCMMHARGDCAIINEPGVQTYLHVYKETKRLDTTYWNNPVQTFAEVENNICKVVNRNAITFVKELGFAACCYLSPESELLKEQDYYVVFLIRDPHSALVSNYKKLPMIQNTLDSILSYKMLYELFQQFKQRGTHQPLIICTKELTADPHNVVAQFCAQVGIPFSANHLSWQPIDEHFSLERDWNCVKPAGVAAHWYDNAMKSSGFVKATSYAVDEYNQPTFEEINNPEHRKFYKKIYSDNMPYYQLFLDECYHGQE